MTDLADVLPLMVLATIGGILFDMARVIVQIKRSQS